MSRPRVVHVTTVPDALIFLRGQVGFVRRRGYDVSVVSSPGPRLDAFAAREGVTTRAVPMTRRITPARDLVSLARMIRVLAELRPDVVHAHTPKGALLGMAAAAVLGVPARIYHLHGLPLVTARGLRRRLLRAVERITAGLATHVVSVGESLRAEVVSTGLVPARRIRVLTRGSINGVDARGHFDPDRVGRAARVAARRDFGLPEDALVFTFVGRIVRDKGIGELLSGWDAVVPAVPHARLLVVGDHEPQDAVAPEHVERLERDPTIVRAGFVEDVARVYVASDVVVLPTHREGFPNVLLEAAAMRRAVVSTRVVGARDAVKDGQTGTLVPAADPDALARAMIAYGGDPELRARHGDAGRAWVLEDYRPEALWEATVALYESALGRPASERSPEATEAPGDRVEGAA